MRSEADAILVGKKTLILITSKLQNRGLKDFLELELFCQKNWI